jgi:DNA repair protein RadC
MSQFNAVNGAVLLVRDAKGGYAPASSDVILDAARHVIESKVQRGEAFTSPEAVKDYLCMKLAGFEHEVFAILMLDNQHLIRTCFSRHLIASQS